jgi:hypothetical protein
MISATGVDWAFGTMEPKPGCTYTQDGNQVDPSTAYPFGTSPSGVFEKQPGGAWVMNYFETVPFPCPDFPGTAEGTPGAGQPWVPLAVLNAVSVPYASSGCTSLYEPPAPR